MYGLLGVLFTVTIIAVYAVGFWLSIIYSKVACSLSTHRSFEWHIFYPITVPLHFVWTRWKINDQITGLKELFRMRAIKVEAWMEKKLNPGEQE